MRLIIPWHLFVIFDPITNDCSHHQTRARRVATGTGEVTYRSVDRPSKVKDDFLNHPSQNRTLDAAFDYAFQKHSSRRCLGTRKIIREEMETQPDGKKFRKLVLGDYEW